MTLTVFLAVLAAAAMHATWNGMIKIRADRFASISVTSLGMAVSAAPLLPFVEVAGGKAWICIVISVIVHIGYRLFLVRAYAVGDLAQTYPLARGSAPLMTTIGGIFLVSELPGPVAMGGIALLSAGTLLMSLRGNAHQHAPNRAAVVNALITALFITAYTLADGLGARLAVSALSYATWLFVCDGLCAIAVGFVYRGRTLLDTIAGEWRPGLISGFLSAASYFIAMWAMTKAPIASVAALRETSILFAMLISVYALKERLTRWRIAAALAIVGGVIALRLG